MGIEDKIADPPEDQWTQISVEKPKRFGPPEEVVFKVPFTGPEVELIRKAKEAEGLLGDRALAGSGVIRELYATHPVTWGGGLIDRVSAIRRLTSTRNYASGIIDRHIKYLTPEEVETIQRLKSSLDSLLGDKVADSDQ